MEATADITETMDIISHTDMDTVIMDMVSDAVMDTVIMDMAMDMGTDMGKSTDSAVEPIIDLHFTYLLSLIY
jgi:hypothetical protein